LSRFRKVENMPRLMDIEELAAYLRLRRQTIYNWLHLGKISGIKVGGVWRFDKKEVDAWLRSQQRKFIPKPMDKN
jgi:excisionase family DNA binding protein